MAAGLLSLACAVSQPALAQFSDNYKFLDSVRKSDNAAVVKAIEVPGVTPINTKDRSTGETALMITVARRDLTWTNYLLTHGARPELTDNQGRTALMIAVERRFPEGAQLLLSKKANPNQTNSSGETPLIRAVQYNDAEMVRILIGAGADPNRRDTLAGMSAIDYATRDNRSQAIIDLLNSKAKAAPSRGVAGPQL
jgi:ankyrin repeat protein